MEEAAEAAQLTTTIYQNSEGFQAKVSAWWGGDLAPCTPHPAPCTLHPAPCTLHPAPYTLNSAPYTLHPSPCPSASLLPAP